MRIHLNTQKNTKKKNRMLHKAVLPTPLNLQQTHLMSGCCIELSYYEAEMTQTTRGSKRTIKKNEVRTLVVKVVPLDVSVPWCLWFLMFHFWSSILKVKVDGKHKWDGTLRNDVLKRCASWPWSDNRTKDAVVFKKKKKSHHESMIDLDLLLSVFGEVPVHTSLEQ